MYIYPFNYFNPLANFRLDIAVKYNKLATFADQLKN